MPNGRVLSKARPFFVLIASNRAGPDPCNSFQRQCHLLNAVDVPAFWIGERLPDGAHIGFARPCVEEGIIARQYLTPFWANYCFCSGKTEQ